VRLIVIPSATRDLMFHKFFEKMGGSYFFDRSFSNPFNSDMNSFTSLKSK